LSRNRSFFVSNCKRFLCQSPNGDRFSVRSEDADAFVVDSDSSFGVAEDVDPLLPSGVLAHPHAFLTSFIARGDKDGSALIFAELRELFVLFSAVFALVCMATESNPTDGPSVVEVIFLQTDGELLTRAKKAGDHLALWFNWCRRVGADAVEVTVEDARLAVPAQQDKRVRERFKPVGHKRLEGLSRLTIMIVNESDGLLGIVLDQGVLEDLGHVEVVGVVACGLEFVVQMNVEQ